jgi:pyruvate kinase
MTETRIKNFAKTKILCTLGPSTASVESIRKLVRTGIDGVRLNLSHGNHDFFQTLFNNIHTVCVEENTSLAILVDLQGPKIRIGELAKPEIEIKTGSLFEISIEDIIGTEKIISTSYKQLVNDASIGDTILINDGLIKLQVKDKTPKSLICLISEGGTLKPRKGMNLPGMKLSTPSVTEKDFRDLEFALNNRVEYVALSFVRSASDIIKLREWLKDKGFTKSIIAKIEKPEALENFDEILKVSDGIMIARGDLGVEMPPQEVPALQKTIIKKCNAVGKLVITATQMLESMINNPVPTRAEASDVANAVWDGTDVVMLSGETSVGQHPFDAVRIMNDILLNSEQHIEISCEHKFQIPQNIEENLFDAVGRGIVSMSQQVRAAAIVVFTYEGRSAKNIAKFRPDAKIIAISNSFNTMNKLCLQWGVTSVYQKEIDKEHIAIDEAKLLIGKLRLVNKGEIILFTAGAPYSEKSRFSWIKFDSIE